MSLYESKVGRMMNGKEAAAHMVPETLSCLWQGGTWYLGTRLSLLLASAGRLETLLPRGALPLGLRPIPRCYSVELLLWSSKYADLAPEGEQHLCQAVLSSQHGWCSKQ
ncbi:hypothetical protein EK904_010112 [Melospiza melodia maxima]|nr:hypothetical protein EK904_010112 [Melospiza melodia maxima]